jgi:vancomycin resistance protein VanJ
VAIVERIGIWFGIWFGISLGIWGLLVALGCESRAPAASVPVEPTSFRPAPAPVFATGEGEFRFTIASYNINFGNGHDPDTVDVVAALDTDVILLQETTEESEAAIRAVLDARYPEIHFHHCCRAGGLGILSRFPIVDEGVLEPTVGPFPAWWARVKTPRGEVLLLDVHLRPPMSDGGSWVVGYFSTRDDRMREMGTFFSQLPTHDLPMIVAGDFNENEKGRAIDLLGRKGLKSALPRFDPRAVTWHWSVAGSELRMMLDHVLTGEPLVPVSASVRHEGVSDHHPVIVELAWR